MQKRGRQWRCNGAPLEPSTLCCYRRVLQQWRSRDAVRSLDLRRHACSC
jgi:hypothetical protein